MTFPTLWRKRIAFVVTVLPAKSGSDVMFCLQHYYGLIINSSRRDL